MKNRIADLKIGSSGDIIVGIPSGRAGYMFRPVLGRLREKYPASQLFLKKAARVTSWSFYKWERSPLSSSPILMTNCL
ncbi:hypothetical protein M5E89_07290 [Acidaminococcus intestini]|nr:hypothetical protein M5E89_07290 [Acidaminococcus intestini]